MNNSSLHKTYFWVIISILPIFLLISGCGSVGKMVSVGTQLGKEIGTMQKMSAEEVEKLVSPDIDLNRIKLDPEGVLGQYVKLAGTADIEGTKGFSSDVTSSRPGDEGISFIMDDAVFIMGLEKSTDIKHGDKVEVIGLVSKSRFLKAMKELYPEEKSIPDLVTVLAKTIRKVPEDTDSKMTGEAAEKITEEKAQPTG